MVVALSVGVLMVLIFRMLALTVLTYLVTATRGGGIYGAGTHGANISGKGNLW